ncbi:MAG: DUF362 domain-containing protein [Burkholderiaceae bacterium]|jgi:uncharacterized protein (DUF362 family)|nr:DUF362 domain-containing protein [Burkholderiaceae bacterium]
MDRRQFIKSVVATTAGTALALKVNGVAQAAAGKSGKGKSAYPDVVAVRNGEPDKMFRTGIAALGGMVAFVKPGQRVVVKPNAAFDAPPERGSNTNPILVGEIVRQCLSAGAADVAVFDNTLNDWRSAYGNSGIGEAVQKAGGRMLPADNESLYKPLTEARAERLKETAVFGALLSADVVINVPVLKNHGGAKMTGAIKNLMGAVWERRSMHRNDLNRSIAEMLYYMKPTLNVVDAYRVMVDHGPRGLSVDDVRLVRHLLLSRDIVAVDAVATRLLKYNQNDVKYIGIASQLGFGNGDIKTIQIKRLNA